MEKKMHEYPITQQIIKIAEKHAEEAGASRVTKVKLVVGDYSGFIGDSIQMYFDIISEGTMCENAMIEIQRVKPKLKCEACGEYFERVLFSFQCPKCGGDGLPTEIGKEFYVDTIEVEQ
jgi:hydrogenase nickel incorporation protein HypA/HybF